MKEKQKPNGDTIPRRQCTAAGVCKWFCSLSTPEKWGVGILSALAVVAAIFGFCNLTAEWMGYKMKMGDALTPGLRFFRDAVIALAAVIGIGTALWRTAAFDRQTRVSENRLLSERFATAAELMAKENYVGQSAIVARVTGARIMENKPAITARISGIHIMEKLAIDAPKEFAEQVVKNLIAYIKEHAQMTATPKLQGQVIPAEPRILGADVKAAFDVLNNILGIPLIKEMIEDKILDFSRANFFGLNLNLEHVRLDYYKRFIETDFRGADLRKATFRDGAILRGAKFQGAYLNDADFRDVNMRDVKLNANLSGTPFITDSDLTGADLRGAILSGAFIKDTKMSGVDVQGANLSPSHFDGEETTMPSYYGATDMTDAVITAPLPDHIKREMRGRIWLNPRAPWAEEIAECSSDIDLQLEMWDCYALAGLVRNLEKGPHSHEVHALVQWARQLLDEDGKVPPESVQLIERMLSEGRR